MKAGITINGLAIINDHPVSWTYAHVQPPGGLANYYRENVTGGPGSFVLEVHDFHTFGEAMTRKLVTEIADVVRDAIGTGRAHRLIDGCSGSQVAWSISDDDGGPLWDRRSMGVLVGSGIGRTARSRALPHAGRFERAPTAISQLGDARRPARARPAATASRPPPAAIISMCRWPVPGRTAR